MSILTKLSPVELAIHDMLLASLTDSESDGWTLVGIDPQPQPKWTSPLCRALRRRQIPARMHRTEEGYETWARWPEETT